MFKMTKKKWLSVLTGSAVVVTMAGSFAAWDVLVKEANFTQQTIDTRMVTSAEINTELAPTVDPTNGPSYKGKVTFTVKGSSDDMTKSQLDLASAVKVDGTTSSLYEIALTDESDNAITDGIALTGTEQNVVCHVTVTPKDAADATFDGISGKTLDVAVTGTVSEKKAS